MLSAESAATVRATLPVVAEHLDAVTARFYDTMLGEHPELLDGLFNRGDQASGEQRRALAGAVAAFASALLARPDERPDALLGRIAHKHASLGVTEDQYTVVHKYLFGAIAHVLGEAATPEVVAAWDEVYRLMAGALIALEARLYADAGHATGRDVWHPWTVTERTEQTPDTVSLTLEPRDGTAAPPAPLPGQYVSVRVRMPDGIRQTRQYTLTGWDGARRRITVKRLRAGSAAPAGEVSTLLHETARPGGTLTVSDPAGDVVLPGGGHPLLFASAGIGCTPVVALLRGLAERGDTRPVLVLHADRSPKHHAHRDEIAALVDALPGARALTWYETGGGDRTGRMDLAGVDVPEGAEAFLCGPLPFMRGVRARLLDAGVPARRVRYEVFGPDLWLGAD